MTLLFIAFFFAAIVSLVFLILAKEYEEDIKWIRDTSDFIQLLFIGVSTLLMAIGLRFF